MRKKPFALFLFLLFVGFGGCSSKHIIVLVPDPDGSTGRIVVSNQAGSVEIDTPYQATNIQDKDSVPTRPVPMEKDKINAIFAEALAIQPSAPVHFLLYFEKITTALNASSLSVLPEIVETIIARNSVDISIIGHADTAGDSNYNLKLSTRRAEAVSRLLIERGIKPECLETSSHGEENPLIRTGDNVSEPRNRRVEVVVR
ncbi:MAG: OmpA family protein [Pseudomonadota bacterium]